MDYRFNEHYGGDMEEDGGGGEWNGGEEGGGFEEDSMSSTERDTLMLKLYTGAIYEDPEYELVQEHKDTPQSQNNTTTTTLKGKEEGERWPKRGTDRHQSDSYLEKEGEREEGGREERGKKREWKKNFNFLENEEWKLNKEANSRAYKPVRNINNNRNKRGWREEEFCSSCCGVDHVDNLNCPNEGLMRNLPGLEVTMKEAALLNCANCGGLDHLAKDCKELSMDQLVEIFYTQEKKLHKIIQKFQINYPSKEPSYSHPKSLNSFRFMRTSSAPNLRNPRGRKQRAEMENEAVGGKYSQNRFNKKRKRNQSNQENDNDDVIVQKWIKIRQKQKKKEKKAFLRKNRKME